MDTESSHSRQEIRKTLEPAFEELVDRVAEHAEQAAAFEETTFEELEESVLEAADQLSCRALGEALEALDPEAEFVVQDGEAYYRCMEGAKTYRTRRGSVRIERGLYRKHGEHNGETICPVESRAGLVGGTWTPSCARKMAYVTQEVPAERAVEMTDMPYSASSFKRVSTELGKDLEEQRDRVESTLTEQIEVPDEAETISVAVDRVSALMREEDGLNWRMLWCGTVQLHDATGEAIETFRYGCVPGAPEEDWRRQMRRDVDAILEQDGDLDRIALGDAGADVIGVLEEDFPDFERLVDYWHVCEKLGAALRAFCSNRPVTREAAEVLSTWKLDLLNDDQAVDAIEESMRRWTVEALPDEAQTTIEAALSYLDNHGDRMCYASKREKGLPIGSGNVEATCKSLVALRMKRNGQRWSYEGAQAMLNLRELALSDRWEAGTDLVLERYREDVTPAPEYAA